jgi:anti-anti-sigma factor
VFDLTRVSFMDSAGLHLLVDMDRTMKAGGGAVKVVNAHTGIAKIFELTGIDRLLTIVPDREAALALVA